MQPNKLERAQKAMRGLVKELKWLREENQRLKLSLSMVMDEDEMLVSELFELYRKEYGEDPTNLSEISLDLH